MPVFTLSVGAVLVAATVYFVARGAPARAALLMGGIALGTLAGQPAAVVQKFFVTLVDEKFVIPICCAMGFAHVLRTSACDVHLVNLLLKPIRRAVTFLVTGTVLIGFVVNIPIISQTSTAVTVGAVLFPLIRAVGLPAVVGGAALLLGSSIGGELINPGAPEFSTIVQEITRLQPDQVLRRSDVVGRVLPLLLADLVIATMVFSWIYRRIPTVNVAAPGEEELRISYVKALVPFVPLGLLFLTSPAFHIIDLPQYWLVAPNPDDPRKAAELFDSRLIGAVMLVGVAAAALAMLLHRESPADVRKLLPSFFDGAGFAFAEIISIIVAAACFAEGIRLVGLGSLIGSVVVAVPWLLLPAAAFVPMGLAFVSGSGMAATQGAYGFFVAPALLNGHDPLEVGGLVALGAAAGRTMSPVSAVALMCGKISESPVAGLVRSVALPLLLGVAGAVLLAAIF